ncbi:hypothetical protein BC332_31959 [Capsicum chinense]|nr:hypothetical protein BC332_31959 [Capsicum chinense]
MLGNWQINGTMRNLNDDVEVDFMPGGRIGIFYEMNLLAENLIESFKLNERSSTFLLNNMTTAPSTVLEKGPLSDANRDVYSEGVLKFALQLNLKYAYISPKKMKMEKMRIYCNNMKVQFRHGPKDGGELIEPEKIDWDVGPGAALKANWETKMDVKNTNHRSSVVIKHMETTLIYRSVELDMSSKDNVEVQKESTVHIMDGFSFPSTRKSYNIEWVVTEIAKDRKRGEIMFDLKIEVQVMIKSRVLIKIDKLRLYCESITLNFKNISSNIPTWDGSNRECKSGL